jgi:hypothetical protein
VSPCRRTPSGVKSGVNTMSGGDDTVSCKVFALGQCWCSASEDPGAQKWYCLLTLRPRRTEPARRRLGLRTGVPTSQDLHA